MDQLSKLSRDEKVMLYVIGMFEDLKAKGLVEGGNTPLTQKGMDLFAGLLASEFRPTHEELEKACRFLTATPQRLTANKPR